MTVFVIRLVAEAADLPPRQFLRRPFKLFTFNIILLTSSYFSITHPAVRASCSVRPQTGGLGKDTSASIEAAWIFHISEDPYSPPVSTVNREAEGDLTNIAVTFARNIQLIWPMFASSLDSSANTSQGHIFISILSSTVSPLFQPPPCISKI